MPSPASDLLPRSTFTSGSLPAPHSLDVELCCSTVWPCGGGVVVVWGGKRREFC